MLLYSVLATAALFAQSERGTISGTITDATGAAVPGAKIAITNANTNQVISTASGETGDFTVPNLPIGQYNVRVAREGFSSEARSGITLNAPSNIASTPN